MFDSTRGARWLLAAALLGATACEGGLPGSELPEDAARLPTDAERADVQHVDAFVPDVGREDAAVVPDVDAAQVDAAVAPVVDAAVVPVVDAAVVPVVDAAVVPVVDAAQVDVAVVPVVDATLPDAMPRDAMLADAMPRDAMLADAMPRDASPLDAAPRDASPPDATLPDAMPRDAMPRDAMPLDASPPDAARPPDVCPDNTWGLFCDAVCDCDDGLFCNGEETCDRELGCVSGVAPAPPASDDPCVAIGPCDESADAFERIARLELPTCGAQSSPPRVRPRDYAFWYWPGNHRFTNNVPISRVMHFLTGHYALTLNEETGDLGQLGVLDGPDSAEQGMRTPVDAVEALPAADLALEGGAGAETVTATSFLGSNGNQTTRARMIDGGRVANWIDIPTLGYGANATYSGALSVISYPRHVVFTHAVTSSAWRADTPALARVSISGAAIASLPNATWLVPDRALELVDAAGRGWVFIVYDAPGAETRLTFDGAAVRATRTQAVAASVSLPVSLLALRRDAVTADELALYLRPAETVQVSYTLLDQHGQRVSDHAVRWNEKFGAFDVPLQSLQAAGGPGGPDYDNNPAMHTWYGRHRLTMNAGGRTGLSVPLAMLGSDRLSWYIVGGAFLFRDPAGEPVGVPVQISKNWHNLYWYHLYAQPTLEAAGPTTVELTVASSRWGETYAASHAQLSLVGWNDSAGGHWDESAIGAFGESVTYDPDQSLNRAMVDDVRPLLVLAGQRWRWTGNVGGADFLRYTALDSPNVMRRMARVRTLHVANGPNLTDVVYQGISSDGRIEGKVRVQMGRTDDLVRVYYHLDYTFLADVTYSRLAFFQMAADNYGDNTFRRYAYGDAAGVRLDAAVPVPGATGYARPEDRGIPLTGDAPWVGLYDAVPRAGDNLKEHLASVGFVVRDFEATIGDTTLRTPHINLNRTNNGNLSQVAFELGLPYEAGAAWCGAACQGQATFVPAGSRVRATIEYVVPPADKALYYGASDYLTALPAAAYTSTDMMLALAGPNRLQVEARVGRVRRVQPVEVEAAPGALAAELTLTGGRGYVPLTFLGLSRHDGWRLERREGEAWVRVDQSVRGNDYWQARFVPEDATYALTFNVRNVQPTDYRLVWVRP